MRLIALVCVLALAAPATLRAEDSPAALTDKAFALFQGSPPGRRAALEALIVLSHFDIGRDRGESAI